MKERRIQITNNISLIKEKENNTEYYLTIYDEKESFKLINIRFTNYNKKDEENFIVIKITSTPNSPKYPFVKELRDTLYNFINEDDSFGTGEFFYLKMSLSNKEFKELVELYTECIKNVCEKYFEEKGV